MAGALGGNHDDIVAGGDLDVAVADVEAVREEQGCAFLQVGGNLLGVNETLNLVGQEDGDDVTLGHGLGNILHLEASGLCLGPGGGAGTQTNDHVNAGILQVKRVCVSLRAVANNGNLLGLDQRQVCAVIVDDLCHC